MFLKNFLDSNTTHVNRIHYNQSNNRNVLIDSQVVLQKSLHLDKRLFNDLIKKQKKTFLSLEIYTHPKVFFNLTKMLLVSNDRQVMNSFKQTRNLADSYFTTEG